jgi:hypothetical protein
MDRELYTAVLETYLDRRLFSTHSTEALAAQVLVMNRFVYVVLSAA